MIVKGQKINDRYQIIKLIGEGGMANVYLAQDTILERKVAVKVLRGDLSSDEKFVRRFQREALSASSLSHPNIVEMYDVGEDNGNFYIVMEYVEGRMLKQIIKKRGVLSIPEVIDISMQLMEGLAHAHDSYIIHRDIKPQNILIKDSGLVKITDFGIAVALNSVELTQTNSVMGSVHYFPPEQASGKGSTIKSDIYSLGIVIFEMLTGKMPFKGDNAVEIALKHMKEDFPCTRKLNTLVPQSLENVVLKATAKNPKNRYNDIREMYQDIKTVMDKTRENEEKIEFKYSEHEFEDVKPKSIIKAETNKNEKEIDSKPIAKEIKENEVIKDNKGMLILISALTSIFVLTMIFIFLIYPKISTTPDIKIPDVAEMTLSQAENKLTKLGFKIEETEKNSDSVEIGLVIDTKPTKNRYAKKGSKIIINISKGTKKIKVDNYIGKNIYEVQAKLELIGLVVSVEKLTVNNSADYVGKENIIIDQDPKENINLVKGDQIILYVPEVLLIYPDFVEDKWKVDAVTGFCEKNNIKLDIEYKETNDFEEGLVIGQNPSANAEIFSGTTLKIVATKKIEEVITSTTAKEAE